LPVISHILTGHTHIACYFSYFNWAHS